MPLGNFIKKAICKIYPLGEERVENFVTPFNLENKKLMLVTSSYDKLIKKN